MLLYRDYFFSVDVPDFGPGLYGVEVLYLPEYVQGAVAVAEYPFFEACAAVAAQFAEELFVYGFLLR